MGEGGGSARTDGDRRLRLPDARVRQHAELVSNGQLGAPPEIPVEVVKRLQGEVGSDFTGLTLQRERRVRVHVQKLKHLN
jgi:hypothetical protein